MSALFVNNANVLQMETLIHFLLVEYNYNS